MAWNPSAPPATWRADPPLGTKHQHRIHDAGVKWAVTVQLRAGFSGLEDHRTGAIPVQTRISGYECNRVLLQIGSLNARN